MASGDSVCMDSFENLQTTDNGQQMCVQSICYTERLNELDKVEFQGRDDDYAPGLILYTKVFYKYGHLLLLYRTRSHLNTCQSDV